MKKVFGSISQVIEKWTELSQPEGRAGSVFFEGNTIYSYGHHFPLASIYQKEKIILVNNGRYSFTTAKHKNWVYRAIRNKYLYKTIEVETPTELYNKQNLIKLRIDIKKYNGLLLSNKTKTYKASYYEFLINLVNDFRFLYNLIYKSALHKLIKNKKTYKRYVKETEKYYKNREKRTINNVLMPKPIFKKIQNKTLKPKDIFKEKNAQRRSVLLNLYTYEKLLKDTEHKIIHTDRDYQLILVKTEKNGQVLRETIRNEKTKIVEDKEILLPEDIMLLKVKCPSTGAYYVLRVPPTMKRCKEALAWTFDMPEKAYILEMET